MAKVTRDSLMRVLCPVALGPQSKFGSIEEQTFWIARAFQRQGGLFLPLFMYPLGSQGAAEYSAAGIKAEHVNLNHLSITTLSRLIRLIHRHRIHVIHWNFYDPLNWYYFALMMLTPGVKHYLTDHGSRILPVRQPVGVKKLVKKALFRGYRKVFGNSDFVVECLKRQGIWNNLSRWRYLINTQRFSPDAVARAHVREELKADKQFVVLVVAQLIPEKGVDVSLRALAELPAHIVLRVDGQEQERGHLQNK
jgi:glycosyltransferase involved in cell wall biosynthesis